MIWILRRILADIAHIYKYEIMVCSKAKNNSQNPTAHRFRSPARQLISRATFY